MAESNPNCTAAAATSASTAATEAAQKPICAICYADLNTLSELLQSIPICGHVFHELCLQHWINYCPAGKELTCPVCKQCYTQHPPTRLYFQSTANSDCTETEEENSNSIAPSLPQGVVIRMELRISALDARVQEVDYKVNRLFRESAEREVTLLRELTRQEQLQFEKITELAKKTAECTKIKEKNSSLSKELSALKSDTKKMKSRCNILTRSEARTQRKLDEALKLNEKLKERIEELQREQEGTTRKASGKRKAEAVSSKLDACSKNKKASKKHKAEALSSETERNVMITRSMVAKKALVHNELVVCTGADEKALKMSNEELKADATCKCVRRVRGLRSLGKSQKTEVEVALPKIENRVGRRRSKAGKN